MGRTVQVGASLDQGDGNAGRGGIHKGIVVLPMRVWLGGEGEPVKPRGRFGGKWHFRDGQVVEMLQGARPKSAFEEMIQKLV